MRRRTPVHVRSGWLLAVAVAATGCASTAGTPAASTGNKPTAAASASARPTASKTPGPLGSATANASATRAAMATASAASSPSGSSAASGPVGLLPIPPGANPWTDNTGAPMDLAAFIVRFFVPASQATESMLYAQRGFVSGGFEGWINLDGSQQSVSIARFASANGAVSAFDDLRNSLRQKPAPWRELTDPADGAVGSADPTLDSEGNAFVDVACRVGDDLVDVHEFSAAAPDPTAATALLLSQVEALKSAAAPPAAG